MFLQILQCENAERRFKKYSMIKSIYKKPVSLKIFRDNYFSNFKSQAMKINGSSKNIYVKIPIINSKGNL